VHWHYTTVLYSTVQGAVGAGVAAGERCGLERKKEAALNCAELQLHRKQLHGCCTIQYCDSRCAVEESTCSALGVIKQVMQEEQEEDLEAEER